MGNNEKVVGALSSLTEVLVAINVATPIIGLTITGIAQLLRLAFDNPDDAVSLTQLADILEGKLGSASAKIQGRIDRLRAKIG